MVTHDFAEVLSLAGRAASPFVADFVGMKNLFKASFSETHAMRA
jgi:ABC-type Fe3+/spermidine/putrescine transport system ATPase subunit